MTIGAVLLGAGTASGIALSLAGTSNEPTAPPAGCSVTATASAVPYSLTPEEAQNASIIAAAAMRKGLPDHAVTVALATSLQETRLQNLHYGDRDSLGLFQQRPSEGWGTRTQIMDPDFAASAFYDHLARVPGWEAMPVTEAAQQVQLSATPTAYAKWEPEARALAVALTGEVPSGFTCRLRGFAGSRPSPSALDEAATTEMGANMLGQAVSAKTGWQVAAWVVAHAYNYHVSSVSFDGSAWTPESGTWSSTADRGSSNAPPVVTFAQG